MQEALSETVTVSMTAHEKRLLLWLSREQGATMRGFIRKLIREAANIQAGGRVHALAPIDETARMVADDGNE